MAKPRSPGGTKRTQSERRRKKKEKEEKEKGKKDRKKKETEKKDRKKDRKGLRSAHQADALLLGHVRVEATADPEFDILTNGRREEISILDRGDEGDVRPQPLRLVVAQVAAV
jgi:hypothetical protein